MCCAVLCVSGCRQVDILMRFYEARGWNRVLRIKTEMITGENLPRILKMPITPPTPPVRPP